MHTITLNHDNCYQKEKLKMRPCDIMNDPACSSGHSADKDIKEGKPRGPSAEDVKRSWAKGCGIMHIVFGVPMITLGIASIFQETWGYKFGAAIWGGVLFLSAGVLGVLCSKTRDRRIRTASVSTAGLSMIVAILAIMVAAVGIALDSVEEKELRRLLQFTGDATLKEYSQNSRLFWVAYTINSLIVAIGSLEIVVGVIQTVILTT
jgi:energy-converting hydrogenase Eha subunit A